MQRIDSLYRAQRNNEGYSSKLWVVVEPVKESRQSHWVAERYVCGATAVTGRLLFVAA